MKRTLAFALLLAVGVVGQAQPPLPATPRALAVATARQDKDKAEKKDDKKDEKKDDKDKDKEKDKDKDDKDAPKEDKDKDKEKDKDDKKDDKPAAPKVPPVLWPTNPFPCPAPPVQDPRTGAWEQVYGPMGVPPPAAAVLPPAVAPPPAAEVLPLPRTANGGVQPVAARVVQPTPIAGEPVVVSPLERPGLRGWLDSFKVRPAAAKRERTINISKNWQTGSWEIDEVPTYPR